MNETPDHFFSGGPYLNVTLPDALQRFVPVNASSLVREWESMLDPLQALRDVSAEPLRDAWLVGKWFAEPGWNTLDLLRQAS